MIDVGKLPGRHKLTQEEINALLVEKGEGGKIVVRLKGGDPFVFGRGGEEGLALAAAKVPFEVVPGVTSAISVPAGAGIPVTHRSVATAFTVVTGHEEPGKEDELDWEALARVGGTIVVLMGVSRLAENVSALLRGGRDPRPRPPSSRGDGAPRRGSSSKPSARSSRGRRARSPRPRRSWWWGRW